MASMLLAELTARAKADRMSLHEKLHALFRRYGYHLERAFSLRMPGAAGMEHIQSLMAGFRRHPPEALAGMPVVQIRDYQNNTLKRPGGAVQPLHGPTGDLVIFDLAMPGNYVAVRPSGTEPLVKFYLFAFQPPEEIKDFQRSRTDLTRTLEIMERDPAPRRDERRGREVGSRE